MRSGRNWKRKPSGSAVAGRRGLLAGDHLARLVEDGRDDRLAVEAGGPDLGLDHDGGRLEVGLADRDLADADVAGGPPGGRHHRVDRRELREIEVAEVGPVAVGEEEDARQREPLEAPGRAGERGPDRRAGAVEGQAVEALDGADVGVEGVAPDVEVLAEPGPPGGLLLEPVADPVAPGRGGVVVADREALAVVGDDGEGVGPAPGPVAGQQGLDQGEHQGGEPQPLEQGRRRP